MSIRTWWYRPILAAVGVAFLYTSASLVADEAGEPKVLFSKTQTIVPVAGHQDYLWGALDLKTGPGMVMEPYGFVQGAKWFGELVLFPETATKRNTFYLYNIDELTEEDALAIARYARDHRDTIMTAFARPYGDAYVGTPIKWNSGLLYTLATIVGVTDMERFWNAIGLDTEDIPGFVPSDEYLNDEQFRSTEAGFGVVKSVIINSENQRFDCIGCAKGLRTAETALYYDDFGLSALAKKKALPEEYPIESEHLYLAINARIEGADHALVGEVVSNPFQPSPGVKIAWPEDD